MMGGYNGYGWGGPGFMNLFWAFPPLAEGWHRCRRRGGPPSRAASGRAVRKAPRLTSSMSPRPAGKSKGTSTWRGAATWNNSASTSTEAGPDGLATGRAAMLQSILHLHLAPQQRDETLKVQRQLHRTQETVLISSMPNSEKTT